MPPTGRRGGRSAADEIDERDTEARREEPLQRGSSIVKLIEDADRRCTRRQGGGAT